jgi:hypothetical protein
MKIETEKGILTEDATENDLVKLFNNNDFEEFVILSYLDKFFIQTSKIGYDSFVVEYHDRDDRGSDRQFQCVNNLSRAEVLSAFTKYLKGDDSWKNMYEWEKLNLKPWWKLW